MRKKNHGRNFECDIFSVSSVTTFPFAHNCLLFQNILRSFATLSLKIVYLVIIVQFQINMVKYSAPITTL